MEFTATPSAVKSALALARKGMTPGEAATVWLSTLDDQGRVIVETADVTISVVFPATVVADGIGETDRARLLAFLDRATGNPVFTTDSRASAQGTLILGIPLAEPSIPGPAPAPDVVVVAGRFARAATRAQATIGRAPADPRLSVARVELTPGGVEVQSSDRYRLTVSTLGGLRSGQAPGEGLLSTRSLAVLAAQKTGTVGLSIDPHGVRVDTGRVTVIDRTVVDSPVGHAVAVYGHHWRSRRVAEALVGAGEVRVVLAGLPGREIVRLSGATGQTALALTGADAPVLVPAGVTGEFDATFEVSKLAASLALVDGPVRIRAESGPDRRSRAVEIAEVGPAASTRTWLVSGS